MTVLAGKLWLEERVSLRWGQHSAEPNPCSTWRLALTSPPCAPSLEERSKGLQCIKQQNSTKNLIHVKGCTRLTMKGSRLGSPALFFLSLFHCVTIPALDQPLKETKAESKDWWYSSFFSFLLLLLFSLPLSGQSKAITFYSIHHTEVYCGSPAPWEVCWGSWEFIKVYCKNYRLAAQHLWKSSNVRACYPTPFKYKQQAGCWTQGNHTKKELPKVQCLLNPDENLQWPS